MKILVFMLLLCSVCAVRVVQFTFKHETKSDLKPFRYHFKYPSKTSKHPSDGNKLSHTREPIATSKKDVPNAAAAQQPTWKKQACEKSNLSETVQSEAGRHFICDDNGELKCIAGWQGDLCDVPICRKGCDPLQGYCKNPGECRCKMGFYGEKCNKCITLPGCQHGYCNQSFECICHKGWDGLFCSEPICREDCHATRGYCESPNECRCRIGWSGPTCRSCQPLPGCQHGYCEKPLECKCHPGYTGLLCQTPICESGCHNEHGYCRRPGECRCKVGWMGRECSQCHPYPGCLHGTCNRPWECNCKPGWGGMLCDEALDYCEKNPDVCKNGGTCQSLEARDGHFRCHCPKGIAGKNCEKLPGNMTTNSTTATNTTEASQNIDNTVNTNTTDDSVTTADNASSTIETNVSDEATETDNASSTTETTKRFKSLIDQITDPFDRLRDNWYNLINIRI